jgi:hypothetical protein
MRKGKGKDRRLTARMMDYFDSRGDFLHVVRYYQDGQWWRAYDKRTGVLLHQAVQLGEGLDWHPIAEELFWRFKAMFMKKALAAIKKNAGGLKGPEDKWLEPFPALKEFMTARKGEDGKERTPSPLSLSFDAGVFKGLLKEVDEGLMLWASAGSYQGVLEALEGQLTSEAPDWRKDKWAKVPGQKKK